MQRLEAGAEVAKKQTLQSAAGQAADAMTALELLRGFPCRQTSPTRRTSRAGIYALEEPAQMDHSPV